MKLHSITLTHEEPEQEVAALAGQSIGAGHYDRSVDPFTHALAGVRWQNGRMATQNLKPYLRTVRIQRTSLQETIDKWQLTPYPNQPPYLGKPMILKPTAISWRMHYIKEVDPVYKRLYTTICKSAHSTQLSEKRRIRS